MNDARRIAGVTSNRAVFWEDARLLEVGAPGLSATYGINSLGEMVGQTTVEGGEPPHAFLYRDGVVSDLGTGFGRSSFSRGWAINDAGDIVGERGPFQLAPSQAFLLRDGKFIDLGTLGGFALRSRSLWPRFTSSLPARVEAGLRHCPRA